MRISASASILALFLLQSQSWAQVGPVEAVRRTEAANAAADAARAEYARAKRQATAYKQRNAMAMKQFQETIVQLEPADRGKWQKVNSNTGSYWKYAIKRTKGPIAFLYYSPKIGYIVDDKRQPSGLGWPTMDEALEKKFGHNGLFTLPEIPGWQKAHLMTPDQHVAEIERKAMEMAKAKAAARIADEATSGIVKELGPKIGQGISKDLGLNKNAVDGKPLDPDLPKPEAEDQSGKVKKRPAGKPKARQVADDK